MELSQFALTDKIAIVTGSSRGIGRSIALGFAKAGAHLVILSRHLSQVEKVAEEVKSLGRKAIAIQADVSKRDEVDRLVGKTLDEFGRIDILVNNAGISPPSMRAEDLPDNEWDKTMDINLKGVFICCQAVGKVMIGQKQGKIINQASIMGMTARTGVIAYSITKAGVIQMTRALGVEWARHNINVNAIAPGWVDTSFIEVVKENKKIEKAYLDSTPLRRFAQPDEIVGAAIFLASESSSFATGMTLRVDGGWTAL